MRTVIITAFLSTTVVIAVACSSSPFVDLSRCAEDAPFPDPWCIDGGIDAGPDAEEGGSNARAACAGRCLPRAYGENAGAWTEPPISVWFGGKNEMPSCCPGSEGCEKDGGPPIANIPTLKYRVFNEIIAPPAECDACDCGASEGTCTQLPVAIEIRSGMCSPNGVSLPFNGPAGWDGSCNTDGALAAGASCNGAPCAQSIWSDALPGPVSESCAPKVVEPGFTAAKVDWGLGALACMGELRDEACVDGEPFCVNDPGPGWLQCVYRDGVWDVCPDNYNQSRIVMYQDKPLDDRGCETCSCGAPVGSGCLGTIPIYNDGACQVEFAKLPVSSFKDNCVGLQPPGVALGAKAFTGLNYMPGACAASGGAAKGNAVADPNQAVTFCCRPLFEIK